MFNRPHSLNDLQVGEGWMYRLSTKFELSKWSLVFETLKTILSIFKAVT